jgi:hypothetical protein
MFLSLEADGYLDVDNEKHLALLHFIFLPRINRGLEKFRDGWNSHPLSSERNYSPNQLMVMHLPPPDFDNSLTQVIQFVLRNTFQ